MVADLLAWLSTLAGRTSLSQMAVDLPLAETCKLEEKCKLEERWKLKTATAWTSRSRSRHLSKELNRLWKVFSN